MAVIIQCPGCGKNYNVSDNSMGSRAHCKSCGQTFTVAIADDDTQLTASKKKLKRGKSLESSVPRPEPKQPEKLGRFEIRQSLGAGAFGLVYRAFDPVLEREVALKVPHASALQDEEAAARFLREPKAAAQLKHPHIVPVYDAGHDGQHYYIASAFIEGRTLDKLLRDEQSGLDSKTAVQIVRKLAEGLYYAHERGIVHRDVKPSNIMIDQLNEPHLLDFGLARWEQSQENLTQDGTRLGTPAYMSPEQAGADVGEVGPTSDQYSLGVVLYELLGGQRPFSGEHSIEALLYQIRKVDPPSLRRLNEDVPLDLETVCLKTLAKHPEERYTNCNELSADLGRWLEGAPIKARRIGLLERSVRWCRREPKLAIGMAVAVTLMLVCLVAGAMIAARRDDSDATPKVVHRKAPESLLPKLLPGPDVALRAGENGVVKVKVDRQGFEGPIPVRLDNLPDNVSSVPATIARSKDSVQLNVVADPAAVVQQRTVHVVASIDNRRIENQFVLRIKEVPSAKPVEVPLEQVPLLTETSAVWQPPDDRSEAEVAQTRRQETLNGLAERQLDNLITEWYSVGTLAMGPGMVPPGFPGAFPPGFAPGTGTPGSNVTTQKKEKPTPIPERFILVGKLGAIRQTAAKTWVYLWTETESEQRTMPGMPPPCVGIEMGNPQVAYWMADYKPGDVLRAVVRRRNWVKPKADEDDYHLTSLRPFQGPGGRTVVYWFFEGEAIERAQDPGGSWIHVRHGRAGQFANSSEIARSPGHLFRTSAQLPGTSGRLLGKFESVRKEGDDLWLRLSVSDSIEGPFIVMANLGAQPELEEFLDYHKGSVVEAEITFESFHVVAGPVATKPGGRPNLVQLVTSRPTRFPPFFVGTTPDPLTTQTTVTARCKRIQIQEMPETLVTASGPRRQDVQNKASPQDEAFARADELQGTEVKWRGRLQKIRHRQDETHLVFTTSGSVFGIYSVEAFTTNSDFIKELADYVDVELSSSKADTVEITGVISRSDAAGFRIEPYAPLLKLKQVQRVGDPNSLAVVGQRREPSSFRKGGLENSFSVALRGGVTVGDEITFNAYFATYSESRDGVSVRTAKSGGRTLTVKFPQASETDFSDYRSNDPITVTAVVSEPLSLQRYGSVSLQGKSVVRAVNPNSLVRAEGRPIPPLDMSAEKDRWRRAKYDDKVKFATFQCGGIYTGYTQGDGYLKINIDRAFFESSSLEVYCGDDEDSRKYLDQLANGDEVLFEFEKSRTVARDRRIILKTMSRIAEPDNKVSFAKVLLK